jgi:choline transport protein
MLRLSRFVWFEFENGTGFSSNFFGAAVGLLGPLTAYGPPHWVMNMAADVKTPSRSIPIAMLSQQVGNIISYVKAFY